MLGFPAMALGQGLVHEGHKKEPPGLFPSTITDMEQAYEVLLVVLKGLP